MATSLEQIRSFLDEHNLRYAVEPDRQAVIVGFRLNPEHTTYRNVDGEAHLGLVILVREEGEYLTIFSPMAWDVEDCPHKAAVLEALATIQGCCKLLRFDYDPEDGEIRPNVELPIEDATLTARQFHRLMHTMLDGVQRSDGVVREAMATGEISMESFDSWKSPYENGPTDATADDAGPDAASSVIDQLRSLADEAGGVDQLERLTGGDWPTEQLVAPAARVEASEPGLEPAIRGPGLLAPAFLGPMVLRLVRRWIWMRWTWIRWTWIRWTWDRCFGGGFWSAADVRKAG